LTDAMPFIIIGAKATTKDNNCKKSCSEREDQAVILSGDRLQFTALQLRYGIDRERFVNL
jgi:hypothetical protein